ncbi:MAG: reverse transcriptase-like protein, partial [Muribaculaceae bacterium]|nr:reverse transcriptase-like protein [Muribaculaceae bacterium]
GGTNNIAEYLALIHALAILENRVYHTTPIYSDSRTAQSWLRNRRSKTTITPDANNAVVMEMLRRADAWIATHTPRNPIIKWDTENWGEIPADFGRK